MTENEKKLAERFDRLVICVSHLADFMSERLVTAKTGRQDLAHIQNRVLACRTGMPSPPSKPPAPPLTECEVAFKKRYCYNDRDRINFDGDQWLGFKAGWDAKESPTETRPSNDRLSGRFDLLATDAATLASLMLDCSTPALSREDREKLIRITNRAIDPQWMKASTPSSLTEVEVAYNSRHGNGEKRGTKPEGIRWRCFKSGWYACRSSAGETSGKPLADCKEAYERHIRCPVAFDGPHNFEGSHWKGFKGGWEARSQK